MNLGEALEHSRAHVNHNTIQMDAKTSTAKLDTTRRWHGSTLQAVDTSMFQMKLSPHLPHTNSYQKMPSAEHEDLVRGNKATSILKMPNEMNTQRMNTHARTHTQILTHLAEELSGPSRIHTRRSSVDTDFKKFEANGQNCVEAIAAAASFVLLISTMS